MGRKIKLIISILLLVVLGFTVTACKKEEPTPEPAPVPVQKTIVATPTVVANTEDELIFSTEKGISYKVIFYVRRQNGCIVQLDNENPLEFPYYGGNLLDYSEQLARAMWSTGDLASIYSFMCCVSSTMDEELYENATSVYVFFRQYDMELDFMGKKIGTRTIEGDQVSFKLSVLECADLLTLPNYKLYIKDYAGNIYPHTIDGTTITATCSEDLSFTCNLWVEWNSWGIAID